MPHLNVLSSGFPQEEDSENIVHKNYKLGAKQVAQQLRIFLILAEDPVLVPCTFLCSADAYMHIGLCVWYIYIHAGKTRMHIKINQAKK